MRIATEPWTPQRVVTGHDTDGTSIVLSDGPPPVTRTAADGAVFHELWSTDATPAGGASPMHRTETIDYGVVLSGEIVLVLDDSETVLRAGDVVVQRGTDHRWENRSAEVTRVAFILNDGGCTGDLRARMGDAELMEEPPGA